VLRNHFTTFAMDRRGFGATPDTDGYSIDVDFADVAAVVDAVAARTGRTVALWGHSYGANCAMGGAARTSNVSHLILYEPSLGLSYPPGSIFKVVVSAAALKNGKKPSDRIAAPDVLKLPGTASATMHNFNNERCGDGKTDTLDHALTISCNTAFGQLGIDLGQQQVEAEAELFGMNNEFRTVPIPVARSTMGEVDDDASLAQASIGQFNVQMTPLQAAMLSAAVANNGTLMTPYLVQQERAPDLSVLKTAVPEQLDSVLDSNQAGELQSMMENVVTKGTGTEAQIPGVKVGGKTGTADNGPVNANGEYVNAPHAWFTGFALDPTHPIAIAVVLENAGVTGSESAGGTAAAPLARMVMQAYLADTRGR